MMRRNASVLISLAATILATSGCSPFRAKLNRRPTDNNLAQHVQPASHTARPAEPQSRPGLAGLPLSGRSTKTPAVDDQTQQWIALARLSERREQYDQAEKIFGKILERVPNHPLPYHRMAIVRAKQSRFDEAEQYFTKAYELDPSNATLLSDIGYFYYLTSDSARSEQFLRYALQFDPQHESAHNNLAILIGERGNLDEARKHFRRVGNEAETEANMAFVYAQRGELSQAVNAYSQALTLDDSMRPAAHALLSLARRQPRETGGSRGREISQTPSSASQPAVMDISSTGGPQPTPARPTQPYRPAEITSGQPVVLDRGVAVVNQPAGQRPGGLLTHLSDFAGSLTTDTSTRPAAATGTVTQGYSTPTRSAPQRQATVRQETQPSSQAALTVLHDIREAGPVTPLRETTDKEISTSPSDAETAADEKEASASCEDKGTWTLTGNSLTKPERTDTSASRSVAPLGRIQRRLNTFRCDGEGDTCDSGSSKSEPRGVIVYQAPEFRPTVSLSISDKSAEGVSPASFSPAKDDATDDTGAAKTSLDAAPSEPADKSVTATPSDSLEAQSSDDTAKASPGEENGFMDTWLTPQPPRESSRRQANHSSRRGA